MIKSIIAAVLVTVTLTSASAQAQSAAGVRDQVAGKDATTTATSTQVQAFRKNGGRQTFSGSGVVRGGGNTDYLSIGGTSTSSADPAAQRLPVYGRFDNLSVRCAAAPGPGNTLAATLRLNGVATGLTVSMTGSATASSTSVLTAPVTAGQVVDLQVTETSAAAATTCSWEAGLAVAPLDQPFFYGFRVAPTSVTINNTSGTTFYTEVPPWVMTVPGFSASIFVFLASTNNSALAQSAQSFTTGSTVNVATAYRFQAENLEAQWAHDYKGAYAGVTLNYGTRNQMLFFANHGENKNQILGTGANLSSRTHQQGTVGSFPIVDSDNNSWSGYRPDGTYGDGYEAYFQFVSGSFTPSNAGNGYGLGTPSIDIGPIAWPVGGYLTSAGARVGGGVGQPSMIDDGTYLYVYYRDDSPQGDGQMVARATIVGLTSAPASTMAQQFETWCGPVKGWLPSLPAGFTPATAANFFASAGPPAQPVLDHGVYRGRLSLAKVNGQKYYLGLNQYSPDGQTWDLDLVQTSDMVDFTTIETLMHGSANDSNMLNYPVFMNKAGTSMTAIDLDDFWVFGSPFGVKNDDPSKLHVINGQYITLR